MLSGDLDCGTGERITMGKLRESRPLPSVELANQVGDEGRRPQRPGSWRRPCPPGMRSAAPQAHSPEQSTSVHAR